MKSILYGALLLLASNAALADGWTADFNITNLYVAQQNNFQYRVYGMAQVPACTNGTNWAYINDNDPGSAGYYAALLIAYTTGKLIRLNLTTAGGFCHIIEMFVSG
jgi:hypothetical protein